MSRIRKTLVRVLSGRADANVRFGDLRALLTHLGFEERIRGDHHIFSFVGVAEILNLQPRGDKAKAYQVKQVRDILIDNGLASEPEDNAPTDASDPADANGPVPDRENGDDR